MFKQQSIQVRALRTVIIALSVVFVVLLVWGLLSLIQTPAPTLHTLPVMTAIIQAQTPDPRFTPVTIAPEVEATARQEHDNRQATMIVAERTRFAAASIPSSTFPTDLWIAILGVILVLLVATSLTLFVQSRNHP